MLSRKKIVQQKPNADLIATEVELVYRNKTMPSERPTVTTSKMAYDLFMKTWDMDKIELQEQFKVMFLNRRNSCLGISTVVTGGLSSVEVDLKLAFATALKATATSIIIAHNHPSGNKTPSSADKNLTERFAQAAKILDIGMLDHLVVTKEGYTSFGDEGLMP